MKHKGTPGGGVQKYSRDTSELFGRLGKASQIGRAPAHQLEGLATYIRGEKFWAALIAEPDLDIRGRVLEAHAKAWGRLVRHKWRQEEPLI